MTIIPCCASTVFLNVIILYLYFSNSVLIVLYVCYDDDVLFLWCVVCFKATGELLCCDATRCDLGVNLWRNEVQMTYCTF